MAEGGAKPKYNKKSWFSGVRSSGSDRGGRGRGRGRGGGGRGGGGRGVGRGGGRGGYGGVDRAGESSGEGKKGHLGRYRDIPLAELMTMPGIMATAIQNKEKSAERELMEHLEQVADELYPETIKKEEEGDGDDDLEAMLQKELEGMKRDKKSNRFRLCIHETTCVFYVGVLEPLDPVRLVHYVLEQTERTAKCPFRYLKRIVPLSAVTNATLPSLRTASLPILESGFSSPNGRSFKYGIMPNTRSSTKLERLDMIKTVADVIGALPGGHKVDLKDQERTVMIELYKGRVGISVVQDYYRFFKYNPISLAEHTAAARDPHKAKSVPADNHRDNETPEEAAQAPSKSTIKHAGRDARAAEIASRSTGVPEKRKVEMEVEEGEAGPKTAKDVEEGEMVEGPEGDALEGDEWEEVIKDGKVFKLRKVE